MADLNKIVDDLSSLTVLEAAELSKMLEEKWGVSAAAPVAVAAAPGAGGGEAAAEEKSEFDVVLAEAGSNKIAVINTDHTNNGNRCQVIPGPRILTIVVIKLLAPIIEDAPAKCKLKIPKSTDGPE